MQDWLTIFKEKRPDFEIRSIARFVGVSRSTVEKALGSDRCLRYMRKKTVSELIEPFRDYIKECYSVKRQRVRVILENLRSKGFTGGRISLYPYVWDYLEDQTGGGNLFAPYETIPAEQTLYDWTEYLIHFGAESIKGLCSSFGVGSESREGLVGYSRYQEVGCF